MAGTETRFCANCGERISVRSRFCPSCGARQEDFRVSDPDVESEPAAVPEPPAAEELRAQEAEPEAPAPEPPAAEELRAQEAEPEPPAPNPPAAGPTEPDARNGTNRVLWPAAARAGSSELNGVSRHEKGVHDRAGRQDL